MVNKCVAFGCKTGYASEKVADCSVENDQKNHVATHMRNIIFANQ